MAKNTDISKMSYETAYAELESTVKQIEGELADLETSIKLFERGQKLAAHCQQILEQAELKVQELTQDGELKDFD
jgi:exodeoxyribonuclease VII small subunit